MIVAGYGSALQKVVPTTLSIPGENISVLQEGWRARPLLVGPSFSEETSWNIPAACNAALIGDAANSICCEGGLVVARFLGNHR